jgi:predicted RNA-binding protein with PUA-like domain
VEVVSEPYPDPTLNETGSGERRGTEPVAVDVQMVRRLSQPVTLAAIKADPFFADFALVRQSRLSVMPVAPEQWARILQMAGETEQ